MSAEPAQSGRAAEAIAAGAEARDVSSASGQPGAAAADGGLIEAVVLATGVGRAPPEDRAERPERVRLDRLDRFLRETSPREALCLWFGWDEVPEDVTREAVVRALGRSIAHIDRLLSCQLDAILHHPEFQQLEASWRGLQYLVEQNEDPEIVKVRVLSVTWKELARDFERAVEFDQSQLFQKVYGNEFGMPGGEPFGVLLGDYQIHPRPSPEHPVDDLEVLSAVSGVAAASFAPWVTGAHPSLLGVDDFAALQQPLDLPAVFDQVEYVKWRAFRQKEDARFVGLTLPSVLMRLPHRDDGSRIDRFVYREDVSGRDSGKYLWGNAAYAFGAVLVREFVRSRWLAEIRGVRPDEDAGGLVPGLPVHSFATDRPGEAPLLSTEVVVTGAREKGLSDLGFIPLCDCPDTPFSAFYSVQSVQQPRQYDSPEATANARISAMLQYSFCVSRFAHYLKVMARDKLGGFAEPPELENYLHRWLQQYVTSDAEASPEAKAEMPLRAANVRIREQPGRAGAYLCTAHLWPHFQLDELATSLKITTEVTPQET